jgi:hypothetical protein
MVPWEMVSVLREEMMEPTRLSRLLGIDLVN